jgi:hypothetical protein
MEVLTRLKHRYGEYISTEVLLKEELLALREAEVKEGKRKSDEDDIRVLRVRLILRTQS